MTASLSSSVPISGRVIALLLMCAPVAFPQPAHAQHEADSVVTLTVQEGTDFRVYDRTGRTVVLSDVLMEASEGDVLLVGEEHDDMPGHAVEALLMDGALGWLGESGRPVVLSLEMFERDVQYIVDEYLSDLISESHFLSSSRPWDDYDARYRPLVESAKRHGAPVIAANAPRRYVNRVTREGPESLESLSDEAKSHLPPLPYPGPSEVYRDQWNALMAEAMAEMDTTEVEVPSPPEEPAPEESEESSDAADSGPDHRETSNAIYSQALWDAAMGHAITTALVENLGALVVHFAGSFHVANGTGIPERIWEYRPGTRVTTVVMTKVEDIDAWSDEEHADLADFIVLTQKPAETVEPGA